MTLGLAERQGRLGSVAVARCEAELPERSIYRLLHAERDRLFPDELFADLYIRHGRRSIPPSILAVVMVLQRLERCSDREAVDRFACDLRWRYAAGVDDEMPGFAHTVLVELRARLRASADPDRIFRVTTELARRVGLVGVRRVLDSAPLFDAVATCDTVTLVRGGIRGLLRVLPVERAAAVRAALLRDDDYQQPGKPVCDWEDAAAREELVDALFRDGYRALFVLGGVQLGPDAAKAAELLATVIGQDIEETADGRFVLAEGVAPDRVLSLVDRRPATGTRPGRTALTATRATSPPIPTVRSSPPPRSARQWWGRGDGGSAAGRPARPVRSRRRVGCRARSRAGRRHRSARADCLRGQRLRHRRAAGRPGGAGRGGDAQGGAGDRPRWAVPQGPVHHRPGRSDGHLPGQAHRGDHPAP
jgi:hypothetical protein